MLADMIGIPVGPISTGELPDNLWVASMFGDGFSGIYALPLRNKQGEVDDFGPVVAKNPQDLARIVQNHDWSKVIKVKMITSKRYTADLNGLEASIVIELVKDHKVRLEAYRQKREQENE